MLSSTCGKKANLAAHVYLLNIQVVNIHVFSTQLIMSDSDAYGRCGKVSAHEQHKMKACNYRTAYALLHISICAITTPIIWQFYYLTTVKFLIAILRNIVHRCCHRRAYGQVRDIYIGACNMRLCHRGAVHELGCGLRAVTSNKWWGKCACDETTQSSGLFFSPYLLLLNNYQYYLRLLAR